MLGLSITFFILAVIAAIFGLGGLAGSLSWLAWVCLAIFLALFVISLTARALRGRSVA